MSESPLQPIRNAKRAAIIIDSEEEEDERTKSLSLSEKEHMLKNLSLLYPEKDAMVLQNILTQANWDPEKANRMLSKQSSPTAEPRRANGLSAHLQKFAHKRRRDHCASSDEEPPSKAHSSNRKKRKEANGSDDEMCDYQAENDDDVDSDDSDIVVSESAQVQVLKFVQNSTIAELKAVQGCSQKKAELIIENRPYSSWRELTYKFDTVKGLNGDILMKVRELLSSRQLMNELMARCQNISQNLSQKVANLANQQSIVTQPPTLNPSLHLKPYQMVGLNWLALMHEENINGILADEMGLGKTVQTIAFLAHLRLLGHGPHLIVVPSSTMDNWIRELEAWLPSAKLLVYYGNQEVRRDLRSAYYNDNIEPLDIVLSTYQMASNTPEDRNFFKRLQFHYVVYDEGHMLKNMKSQRYQSLMRMNSKRKLLLTGTPLQNNLMELISLLIFIMPNLFTNKVDQIKLMFSSAPGQKTTQQDNEPKSNYERKKINAAKQIMQPFILRRLKSEVLQQLPKKSEEVRLVPLSESQQQFYSELVTRLSEEYRSNDHTKENHQGSLMKLRKAANHPLLFRRHYTDEALEVMSKLILKDSNFSHCNPVLVKEDMSFMSDFQLHKLCANSPEVMGPHMLPPDLLLDSGKMAALDDILPPIKARGEKVLLFSQFTMMLDVLEVYLELRNYRFLRLDGTTPVADRQDLIDEFSEEEELFVFLLSTKAGGLGINLTAASTVVIHDIDFNPYNDKQAEDRCHRMGQTKDVMIIRLIGKETIEEGMYASAQDKLRLEKHITKEGEEDDSAANVKRLLKTALQLT